MRRQHAISLVAAAFVLHAADRDARSQLPRGEEMRPSWGSYLWKCAAGTWRSR